MRTKEPKMESSSKLATINLIKQLSTIATICLFQSCMAIFIACHHLHASFELNVD